MFLAPFFMKFLVVKVLFIPKCPENWPFLLLKKSKNFQKLSFLAPETFFLSNFNTGDNFYINKGLL